MIWTAPCTFTAEEVDTGGADLRLGGRLVTRGEQAASSRLAFALLLKFFERDGRLSRHLGEVLAPGFRDHVTGLGKTRLLHVTITSAHADATAAPATITA